MRSRNGMTRILGLLISVATLVAVGIGATGEDAGSALLPLAGRWTPPAGVHAGRPPSNKGTVEIRGLGTFEFDPPQIQALRKDLFRPGHFSVFDVLASLAKAGTIPMEYSYDESLGTYVIESLNGKSGWWYDAHYAGGAFERPVVRMDEYPVKDGMAIQLYLESPDRLAAITQDFAEQVARLRSNGGRVVVPKVTVRSPRATLTFNDVGVTAHNVRSDVFQTGVITVLDVLLSLGEQGRLSSLELAWRDRMENADPVDNYFVDQVRTEDYSTEAAGDCTYVHEVGSEALMGFLAPHGHATSHVHLTADVEVLTSPEYVEFLWACLQEARASGENKNPQAKD